MFREVCDEQLLWHRFGRQDFPRVQQQEGRAPQKMQVGKDTQTLNDHTTISFTAVIYQLLSHRDVRLTCLAGGENLTLPCTRLTK